MKKLHLYSLYTLLSLIIFAGESFAVEQMIDRIVAVVGEEIILLSDIQQKMNVVMMNRNLDVNSPSQVLRKLQIEILQGEIDDRLLIAKAEHDSLVADPRQVDMILNQRISELKQQLGSEENYQKALQENGFTEYQLRRMYHFMAEKNVLQEMILQNIRRLISVTPQEIETWYEAYRDSMPEIPEQFKLSHLMLIPKVSKERKQEIRKKLEGIRERILAGEDFGEQAKRYSEDPVSAPDGGDVGYFRRGIMIDEFTDAAFSLKAGEVSEIIETLYGLHIIKLEDRREDEVKASHILLRLVAGEEDEKAVVERLKEMRSRIIAGDVSFEEMAKEYSEDPESSNLGGKMKWLTREAIVNVAKIPSFYNEAKKLEKVGISEPFKSNYGYHILALDDYRPEHTLNPIDDRSIIENQLYQGKTIKELERILAKLRAETYIDIRME